MCKNSKNILHNLLVGCFLDFLFLLYCLKKKFFFILLSPFEVHIKKRKKYFSLYLYVMQCYFKSKCLSVLSVVSATMKLNIFIEVLKKNNNTATNINIHKYFLCLMFKFILFTHRIHIDKLIHTYILINRHKCIARKYFYSILKKY